MAEKRNLKNATKYFKVALAGTLLASVGNAYTFDIINAEDGIDSNGDVKVEQLMKINNVLSNTAYVDVKSNYWALDSINWAVDKGLLSVDKDGRFRPNDLLTEAEFAQLLVEYYRMHNMELSGSYLFSKEHWANDAYVRLSKYGVPMLGYNLLEFRDLPVRKGLFAQAISYLNGNLEDIDESVREVFEMGLKNGDTFNHNDLSQQYLLKQNISRVHATVFIHRMFNKGITENKAPYDNDGSKTEEELIEEATERVDENGLSDEEKKAKDKARDEIKGEDKNEEVSKGGSNNGSSSSIVTPPKADSGSSNNDSGYTKPNKPKGEVKPNPTPKPKPDPKPHQPVITTKNVNETETIGFKTVEQYDNTLEKGKTKVVQNGQNGTKTLTYKITYKDGKQVSKDLISSKVTKNPVDKIVKIGTKEKPKDTNPGGSPADLVSGVYSGYGMSVQGSGSGYGAYGNGHEHIYTGSYMNIKFTGNYSTFDIATQALSKLGKNINVRAGAEQLANSGKYSVVYAGVTFSLDGAYVKVDW